MQFIIKGQIITLDSGNPRVQAVLVDNQRILAVGNLAELKNLSSKAEIIDLEDQFLTPGLVDAHIHLVSYGLKLSQPDLTKANSLDKILYLLEKYSKECDQVVFATGFEQNRLQEPNLGQLDKICPHKPLLLRSRDGHIAWANSQALRLAGLSEAKLVEKQIELVEKVMPKPSFESLVQAAKLATDDLFARGLTTVHTMAYEPLEFLLALCELERRGELSVGIWACLDHNHLQALSMFPKTERIEVGGAKFFADGSLSSRTAWFFQPYLDQNNCGMTVDVPELILERGRQALELGLSPVVHAIGDRAVHEVLGVFAKLKPLAEKKGLPLRLEHAQHLDPADIKRFAELGIIVSVQPLHYLDDRTLIPRILGPERAKNSFALRALQASGAKLIFGSDAPVASPDPLLNLQAATELGLTPSEALQAYTQNQIKAGNKAEFTLWAKDPSEEISPPLAFSPRLAVQ